MRLFSSRGLLGIAQIASVLFIVLSGYLLHQFDKRSSINEAQSTLLMEKSHVSSFLVGEFSIVEMLGRAVAATASRFPDMSQQDFALLAQSIRADRVEIVNIAFAPDMVVEYVYPFAENRTVMGLDYRADTPFGVGVDQAISTGQTVLVGPIELVQGGEAMILRIPVKTDPATGSEMNSIISLVVDTETFFAQAGVGPVMGDIEVAVQHPSASGGAPEMLFGAPSVCGPSSLRREIALSSDVWTLCIVPANGWPTRGENSNLIAFVTILMAVTTSLAFRAINQLRLGERQARQQLLDAIEAIDDGFALFDKDDRLVLCNSKYREIYKESVGMMKPGNTFEEIIAYGIENGQYPDAIGHEDEFLKERMRAHQQLGADVEQQMPDGRWLKIAERRMSDGGIVGFRVDVTDLKTAREAAEAANKATTQFLNNINHEMRTPLTVIVGFTRFLSEPELLPSSKALRCTLNDPDANPAQISDKLDGYVAETKTYAQRILGSGQHLLDLVQDTLDFAKIQKGELSINAEDVTLEPAVATCVQQFAAQADQKNLKVTADCDDISVRADPVRLRQILTNVIGNAVKFTDQGGVSITCKRVGCFASIDVQDTGPGIAKENRSRIFERFWQADGSVTRDHGGTGLGLAISQQLVELLGGEIELLDHPGPGATFRIKLPLSMADGASQDGIVERQAS